jgi:hypothetical protein
MSGLFKPDYFTDKSWRTGDFITTATLIKCLNNFDKRGQKFAAPTSKEISDAIARLCPSAIKGRQKVLGAQHRGYQLPGLGVARQEFERTYNCSVDWDECEADASEERLDDNSESTKDEVAIVATIGHDTWHSQVQ